MKGLYFLGRVKAGTRVSKDTVHSSRALTDANSGINLGHGALKLFRNTLTYGFTGLTRCIFLQFSLNLLQVKLFRMGHVNARNFIKAVETSE
jgi:hypothetical protein